MSFSQLQLYYKKPYLLIFGEGIDPWMDKINLAPGQDWHLEIQKAIKDADFFIACLSTQSISKKGYIQKELKTAFETLDELPEGKVFFIPVRIDDCEVPSQVKDKQWLNWWETDAKNKLLRALVVSK